SSDAARVCAAGIPGVSPRQGRVAEHDLGAPVRRARREHLQRRGRVHSLSSHQARQGFRAAVDSDALGRRLHAAGRGRLSVRLRAEGPMKSIRLSLVVYFLVLLTGALGVVFALVYRTTAGALEERRDSSRKLIETQYEAQCNEVRAALDIRLRQQAR